MTSPPPLEGEDLSRLKRAEATNRRETRKMGLEAQPISVEALWLLQSGRCKCGCGEIMDPAARWPDQECIVIAHEKARGYKNTSHAGHTVGNVWLWKNGHNRAAASIEKRDAGKANRMGYELLKVEKPEPKKTKSGHRPMPGSRNTPFKRKIGGQTVRRTS